MFGKLRQDAEDIALVVHYLVPQLSGLGFEEIVSMDLGSDPGAAIKLI